jgi:hypothetical protein
MRQKPVEKTALTTFVSKLHKPKKFRQKIMKSSELTELRQLIHSARNSLNSIVLHAELGKMLTETNDDIDQINNAFKVILQ